jgi:hypothetical protein
MCCDTAWQIIDSRRRHGGWMTRKADPVLKEPSELSEAAPISAGQQEGASQQATSGDLLSDVYYLAQQMAGETDARLCGLYARSTIVMSFATIEAITNDALATIYELLTDSIPAGSNKLPPWSYFVGRSTDRIKSLLRRGAFFRRQRYVLGQIKRTTGRTIDSALAKEIEDLRNFRNGIVHMSFVEKRGHYDAVLDAGELVDVASSAPSTVQGYLDFVSTAFAELKLPIQTFRSYGTERGVGQSR